MPRLNNMGTYVLSTGTYTIKLTDGIKVMALKLSAGGEATVKGSAHSSDLGPSVPLTLNPLEPTLLSNQEPMDGVEIIVISGTLKIITNQ